MRLAFYHCNFIFYSDSIHNTREGNGTPLQYACLEWRSLAGCSSWGRWESHTTEQLHFHFSLSCIGEGNGNPLQCSCLENLRDGGAWWAAVYGVAQSRTRLKWLSSSSSTHNTNCWKVGNSFPRFITKPNISSPLLASQHFFFFLLTKLPLWLNGKASACQCRRCQFDPWVRMFPWHRKWQPPPVFLPGKYHGQRSPRRATVHGLAKDSDTTEQLNNNKDIR